MLAAFAVLSMAGNWLPNIHYGQFIIRTQLISSLHRVLTVTSFHYSESVSIPKNPRTDRPVGYAFVDLSTPSEAERAIEELSGKEILERKVSVQLARKPEPAGEKADAANGEGSGGEGSRRRASGRGRGRGRGRGGRGGRGGRAGVSVLFSASSKTRCLTRALQDAGDDKKEGETGADDAQAAATDADANTEVQPLQDITNKNATTDKAEKTSKNQARAPRERRERGPPADGIASKTKVMVANLPYDLTEEKVGRALLDIYKLCPSLTVIFSAY